MRALPLFLAASLLTVTAPVHAQPQPQPMPAAPMPAAPTQPAPWPPPYASPPGPWAAPPPYWTPMPQRTRYRSEGMRTAGIILTTLGLLSIVGGLSVVIEDAHQDYDGLLIVIAGVPLFGSAAIMGAIGIPLWAVGSQKVPDVPSAEARRWIPAIAAGPGGTALKWSF